MSKVRNSPWKWITTSYDMSSVVIVGQDGEKFYPEDSELEELLRRSNHYDDLVNALKELKRPGAWAFMNLVDQKRIDDALKKAGEL